MDPALPTGMSEENAEQNAIDLTSEGHGRLFYHDWELIKLFDAPLSKANAHIGVLEEKLRQSIEDGDQTRKQLYNTEASLHDASSGRTTFERHLHLEQHESGLLRAKHYKLSNDMDAMLTYNEMLRQDVEHLQKIIESMATTIATHESEANSLVESRKEQSEYAAQQWLEGGLCPSAPEESSGSDNTGANAEDSQCKASEPTTAGEVGMNLPLKRLAESRVDGQEKRAKKVKSKTPQKASKMKDDSR